MTKNKEEYLKLILRWAKMETYFDSEEYIKLDEETKEKYYFAGRDLSKAIAQVFKQLIN
jgi:hypothetical protein